jgi:hypothetical protein
VSDGREVEDEIDEVLVVIDLWPKRRSKELVGNDRVNVIFLHE